MPKSPVFEETYNHYLAEISSLDYLSRAGTLGVEVEDNSLIIPLYDEVYRVSKEGVHDTRGSTVTPAVQVILCKYVLMCPAEIPVIPDRLMSYREFKDAGPLVSYFTSNTNKTIESHFSGKVEPFKERALSLGAAIATNESYDLSLHFYALPRIPVILNFNDSDEMFPASCSILYKQTAEHYLDMECLAMTGTLLAGKLIKP
jgi:hypothetical protein